MMTIFVGEEGTVTIEEDIVAKLQEMPDDMKLEALQFVEVLHKRHVGNAKGKLRMDWAGGLKEYRDKYTSLELQKKSLDWRIG